MIRYFAAAGLLLSLSACSQGTDKTAAGADPYAGLQPQIAAWHDAIENNHVACQNKINGKGCESFEVTCKAAQDITADDKAAGVTAKVIAAMSFSARTPDGSSGKPGSAFATFSKANGSWTRAEAKPVNMSSCAPL